MIALFSSHLERIAGWPPRVNAPVASCAWWVAACTMQSVPPAEPACQPPG